MLFFLSMKAFFLFLALGILAPHSNSESTSIKPYSFQPSCAPVLATWLRTAASRMVWMSLQPAIATSITLGRWSRWNLGQVVR